jgi:hypothetical protein
MAREELNQAFREIIDTAARKLSAQDFRRVGTTLRIIRNECAGIIEFQKSTTSSNDCIRFTINLALACGALLEPDQPTLEKIRSPEAHLRLRIGMLMPGRPDMWWEIKDAADVSELAEEISTLIATAGAPYVVRYLDRKELISLWESGQSPGLTESQRVRYLHRLNQSGEA